MEIKRILDTSTAKYDLLNLNQKEFDMLVNAYQHYMYYIQHAPPSDEDSMWEKMQKIVHSSITIV